MNATAAPRPTDSERDLGAEAASPPAPEAAEAGLPAQQFELLRAYGPRVPARLCAAWSEAERIIEQAQERAAGLQCEAERQRAQQQARLVRSLQEILTRRSTRRRRRLALAYHLKMERLCLAASEAALSVASSCWRQPPADTGPTVRAVARALLKQVPASAGRESQRPIEITVACGTSAPLSRALAEASEASTQILIKEASSLEPGDVTLSAGAFELDARVRTRANGLVEALAADLECPTPELS